MICLVRHLMKDADNLLSFTEFRERFDVKTNFLVCHGVVSCIKLSRNVIENQTEKEKKNPEISVILWRTS